MHLSEELQELLIKRHKLTAAMDNIRTDKFNVENQIVDKVLEARMFECITINYARLSRMISKTVNND